MVCPSSPLPAEDGSRIRMLHALDALRSVAEVTVVVLQDPYGRAALLDGLGVEVISVAHRRRRVRALVWSLLRGIPYHVELFRSRELRRAVADLVADGRYDLIWCHHLHTAANIEKGTVPVLVDQHQLEPAYWESVARASGNPAMRLLGRIQASHWRRVYPALLERCAAVVCVSIPEARRTRAAAAPGCRVWVAPNGGRLHAEPPARIREPGEPPTIIFCASTHVPMNADAASRLVRGVVPHLTRRLGEVQTLIVGGHPPPSVRALGREDGVTVVGPVAAVEPYYARADVAVVPCRYGAGTKLKVMEAMALGVPVVATTTAAGGLRVRHGRELLIADGERAIADAVSAILADPQLASRLATAARKCVAERYAWERCYAAVPGWIEAMSSWPRPRDEPGAETLSAARAPLPTRSFPSSPSVRPA